MISEETDNDEIYYEEEDPAYYYDEIDDYDDLENEKGDGDDYSHDK